jgi:hypothetical protein
VSEPIVLTVDEVFRIHARCLAEHGGSEGVRDSGLIEFGAGVREKHARLRKGRGVRGGGELCVSPGRVASVHGWQQANRRRIRVGLPGENGVYARPATWELYNAMMDLAEKKQNKSDLAELFRKLAGK